MITYKTGDATNPEEDNCVIAHVCNNKGLWGAGFVLAVSRRWGAPEHYYRRMNVVRLGHIQIVPVDACNVRAVVNMIAQDGFGGVAIDYTQLELCLTDLDDRLQKDVTVVMPRIGCGLGGGDWKVVEEILNFVMRDRNVVVYDLP